MKDSIWLIMVAFNVILFDGIMEILIKIYDKLYNVTTATYEHVIIWIIVVIATVLNNIEIKDKT